jgi:DNA replication and repair protein RecF
MRDPATQRAPGREPREHALRIESLRTRGFRNLAPGEVPLGEAITVAHGPNGAGKTNLLEALYFGLVGRSCRTSNDRELIRFGESLARVEVDASDAGERRRFLASIGRSDGRRHLFEGAPLNGDLARRPAVAVFMPDRLGLIKGPPAPRRGHLDRLVAALWPARAAARLGFGRALAQRNALLTRVRTGQASAASLDAWDLELAREAVEVIDARAEAIELLAPPFSRAATELGMSGAATLRYVPRSEARTPEVLAAELRERRSADIERARTTHGPHLDELELSLNGHSVRRFGSQGEQRMALLSLLFAERDLLQAERGRAPLLLLDDVLSELDPGRRELLIERLAGGGQVLITATHLAQLPDCERDQIEVEAGRARPAQELGG